MCSLVAVFQGSGQDDHRFTGVPDPGGPALAQRIIDYRTQHGPFRSVDDLLDVRGIGPAKLDEMRALVRV